MSNSRIGNLGPRALWVVLLLVTAGVGGTVVYVCEVAARARFRSASIGCTTGEELYGNGQYGDTVDHFLRAHSSPEHRHALLGAEEYAVFVLALARVRPLDSIRELRCVAQPYKTPDECLHSVAMRAMLCFKRDDSNYDGRLFYEFITARNSCPFC